MIKYLGSKRSLVPVLGDIAERVGARTAVDLFTGTTRVAQELKRRGLLVTATDVATYSQVLSDCYIATDAAGVDLASLDEEIARLAALPGRPGYFTRTFCEESRFFQPKNGARVDAIRDALEADHRDSPLFPILLTSLMLAADRVDSTTGLQMAYLKEWAPRATQDLELRRPELLAGPGATGGTGPGLSEGPVRGPSEGPVRGPSDASPATAFGEPGQGLLPAEALMLPAVRRRAARAAVRSDQPIPRQRRQRPVHALARRLPGAK